MEQPQANCNFCGKHLVMGEILYTSSAQVACVDCNKKVDLYQADVNVGSNILKAAIFSIAAAPLALVVMLFPSIPFLLMGLVLAIASVWSGIYALRAVNQKGDERFIQHVQKDKGTVYALSIIGMVISGFCLIVIALAFVSIATRPPANEVHYEYRSY